MRLKKILLSFVLVAVLSFVSVVPAFATTTVATTEKASITAIAAVEDSDDLIYIDKETGLHWEKKGTKLYCSTADDLPVKGWVVFGDYVYYMNKKGMMRTGWILAGGNWYYLYKTEDDMGDLVGTLATKTWIDNYYVDEFGVWTKTR